MRDPRRFPLLAVLTVAAQILAKGMVALITRIETLRQVSWNPLVRVLFWGGALVFLLAAVALLFGGMQYLQLSLPGRLLRTEKWQTIAQIYVCFALPILAWLFLPEPEYIAVGYAMGFMWLLPLCRKDAHITLPPAGKRAAGALYLALLLTPMGAILWNKPWQAVEGLLVMAVILWIQGKRQQWKAR